MSSKSESSSGKNRSTANKKKRLDEDPFSTEAYTTDNFNPDLSDENKRTPTPQFGIASLSKKRKGFLTHLGFYVIIIGFLGLINLLTDPGGYPWFLWPALGWGVGVAFNLHDVLLSEMTNISSKWKGFLGHFGAYGIIMGLLLGIYLMSNPGGYPWFLWPALGWGLAIAIHLFGAIMSDDSARDEEFDLDEQFDFDETTNTRHEKRKRKRKKDKYQEKEPHNQTAPTPIADSAIKNHLQKARTYQRQIKSLIQSSSKNNVHTRPEELLRQIDEWLRAIEILARRVESYQQNSVIQNDLASVPKSINNLEQQLTNETDATTRAELERTLDVRKNQLDALQQLQSTMRRAEIKIESTLSSLGTIYSQLLNSQSTDHVADYSRLSEDVEEEVQTLEDHLEALEEVKFGRL